MFFATISLEMYDFHTKYYENSRTTTYLSCSVCAKRPVLNEFTVQIYVMLVPYSRTDEQDAALKKNIVV